VAEGIWEQEAIKPAKHLTPPVAFATLTLRRLLFDSKWRHTLNIHTVYVHTRCPFAPVWDYYKVVVRTPDFLKCEDLQSICDKVRGLEMTQENVMREIRSKLNRSCRVTVTGRHGSNGRLEITG
jgi:hypothetical protein